MRRVQRFICDECQREHASPEMAERCEASDRKMQEERAARLAEEKRWQDQGHDVWVENGVLCHAMRVDPDKYGSHDYGSREGTCDCAHRCKCWAGGFASGGPVDPFGACPNNPKETGGEDNQAVRQLRTLCSELRQVR